jgi:hypothetical protein
MNLEDFKRWHWMVIGTLLGLTVGYLQTAVGFDPLSAPTRALEQPIFEAELHQQVLGAPTIKDVTLYPNGSLIMVKFQRLMRSTDGRTYVYGQWQMTPPVPYQPSTGPNRDRGLHYTVADYLAELHANDTSIRYGFAWWATKPMTVFLWTAGGLILIGGIWPTVVNLLIGAGFGRAKPADDAYDLSRFQREADLLPAPAPVVDEQMLRLRELEEELAKNAQTATCEQAPNAAAPAPKPLVAQPLEPLPPVAQEEKDYAGEFYPVARSTHKNTPDEE